MRSPSSDAVHADVGLSWKTFDRTLTLLEKLDLQPDVPITELLDEADIIQEFKNNNKKLEDRLCRPDATKALLEFIIQLPPDEASENRCRRYPFVAVELMIYGADKFFKVLYGTRDLFDFFWSFIKYTPPIEEDTVQLDKTVVLAGYFTRTVIAFLAKHRSQVVELLWERSEDLLEEFLARLHLTSIAEVFKELLCAEQEAHLLFPVDGLVMKLLSRLEVPVSGVEASDTHDGVALVVKELLGQTHRKLCFGEDLLQQLTSERAVRLLVKHFFGEVPSAVAAAASIMQSIFQYVHVAPKDTSKDLVAPAQAPLPLPSSPRHIDDDLVKANALDDSRGTGEATIAASRAIHLTPDCSSTQGVESATWLETRGASFVRELCLIVPQIRGILVEKLNEIPKDPPQVSKQATHIVKPGEMRMVYDDSGIVQEVRTDGPAHTQIIKKGDQILKVGTEFQEDYRIFKMKTGTEPFSKDALHRAERSGFDYEVLVAPPACWNNPIGSTTINVIKLLVMLVRTASREVLEAVDKEQLLCLCVDLFFRKPWSTLLHNEVKALICELLASPDGMRTILLKTLLRDKLDKFVEQYEAERQMQKLDPLARKTPRVGFMGPLHEICKQIRDYGTKVLEIQQLLDDSQQWAEVVLVEINATHKLYSEELGGSTKGVSTVRLNSLAQLTLDEGPFFNTREEPEEFTFDSLDDEDPFRPDSSFVIPSTGTAFGDSLPINVF